MKCFY